MSEPLAVEGDQGHAADDIALIRAVRRGDIAAYGVLYERHVGAARRVAAAVATTRAERDDLVAESFTKILRILRAGRGPSEQFRAYLLATVRNSLINWRRHDSPVTPVADPPEKPPDDGREDQVDSRLYAEVATAAFARLPDRWRLALWYTEVEGRSPAQVAPLLGMTPNGVAALAYRAREGLRKAYLDEHLPAVAQRECRTTVEQLAGWARHTLPAGRTQVIDRHLSRCADCRELAAELHRLNQELPAHRASR